MRYHRRKEERILQRLREEGLNKMQLKMDYAPSLRNEENFFPYISIKDYSLVDSVWPVVKNDGWKLRGYVADPNQAGINIDVTRVLLLQVYFTLQWLRYYLEFSSHPNE